MVTVGSVGFVELLFEFMFSKVSMLWYEMVGMLWYETVGINVEKADEGSLRFLFIVGLVSK